MRSLLLSLVVFVAPAFAEERTWTISTGTYTATAELLEVRGDTAYLKMGERVEEVPLARLSAADQNFIASQSRAPIRPGPLDDPAEPATLPAAYNEFNALPPAEVAPEKAAPMQRVDAKKPVVDSPVREQIPVPVRNRVIQAEELLPVPATTGSTKNRTTKNDPRTLNNYNTNSNPRSSKSQQKQSNSQQQQLSNQQKMQQQQQNTSNRDRSRDDERRGLFGQRSRRFANGR